RDGGLRVYFSLFTQGTRDAIPSTKSRAGSSPVDVRPTLMHTQGSVALARYACGTFLPCCAPPTFSVNQTPTAVSMRLRAALKIVINAAMLEDLRSVQSVMLHIEQHRACIR